MRPDTLRRVRIANDIVDNPEHPAWENIRRRMETDLQEPPLVVLGQGDFTQEIHGKDVTGFFPLARAVRGFGRALLRFLGARR